MLLLAKLIYIFNVWFNSCEINYKSKIGEGFKIYHSIGIVLGKVIAGTEFQIYQNVTVGANHRTNEKGETNPIFGNNVTIYSGAVVAGPIAIGDNVRIGANTTVFRDLPSNSTVKNAMPEVITRS